MLETGGVYLVPLQESLALPERVAAATNPKSSTGRIDVFTRVITDFGAAFDTVCAGYKGALYLEISPRTFPILVRTGSRLAQIRFRRGHRAPSDDELRQLQHTIGLVHGADDIEGDIEADIDGGLALSIDLQGAENAVGDIIGYRAIRHAGLIDVDSVAQLEVAQFWDPLYQRGDRQLILDPDEFYILASREAITIPPTHAAEMMPFNPMMGEFRVHYAGFFDPGFGAEEAGGQRARAVLEVRSREVPFIVEHGQIIGRLVYERLTETPEKLYGAGLKSHYQAQGLKLSKHFKQDGRKSRAKNLGQCQLNRANVMPPFLSLKQCHNVEDLRALACRRLPAPIFHYIDGAADDEVTYRRNSQAFDDYDLVPNILAGVADIDMSVRVLGHRLDLPIFCAPTALQRLFHHMGERAVARAAEKYNTLFGVSSLGTVSLAEIGALIATPKMFQFYFHKDRALNAAMLEMAKQAKFDILTLTVDTITGGNRERDLRTGFTSPPRLTLNSLLAFARKPRWTLNYLLREKFELSQLKDYVGQGSNHRHFN